jgi:predicted membrane-bound spermidine synthase
VSALLTLAIFSFLIKDNPLYKIAEHIFVGASAGYWFVFNFHNVLLPDLFKPLGTEFTSKWFLLIPLGLGLLMLMKMSRQYGWLARFPLAFTVGIGAGEGITSIIKSDIISQLSAVTFEMPLIMLTENMGKMQINVFNSFSNIVYFLAVVTGLLYFFFSAEHKGMVGKTARIGIWFLMISFGASFGFTVMARISLLINRLQFLIEDFLGIVI